MPIADLTREYDLYASGVNTEMISKLYQPITSLIYRPLNSDLQRRQHGVNNIYVSRLSVAFDLGVNLKKDRVLKMEIIYCIHKMLFKDTLFEKFRTNISLQNNEWVKWIIKNS